ncbi:Protein disulfide-isomerase LQY1, chloroplastic [Capsicum annuum]|nr:Protein disulfide-isomerase LQY1, chloroplastic [Capsicum annuum]
MKDMKQGGMEVEDMKKMKKWGGGYEEDEEIGVLGVIAISVGVLSVAIGVGIPVFYETQIDNAAKRENTQPCFPCNGTGAQKCRFCLGTGNVTVELGGGEKEVSRCINCDGAGGLTCTTCQGSGIQPRYLDRSQSFSYAGSIWPFTSIGETNTRSVIFSCAGNLRMMIRYGRIFTMDATACLSSSRRPVIVTWDIIDKKIL